MQLALDSISKKVGPQTWLHDMSLALERWVEQGVAPGQIVATRYRDGSPASGVELTRPLCPYPARSVYSGRGDPALAANHRCLRES